MLASTLFSYMLYKYSSETSSLIPNILLCIFRIIYMYV